MILTHKERLLRALRHQPVDRLPTQINYTAGMGRLLAAHYGVSAGELPAVLDNHLVRVDVDHPERLSVDGLARFDWWGAGHDTAEEGYYIRVSPLAESKDLDAFPWPDPHAPGPAQYRGAHDCSARRRVLHRAQSRLRPVRAGVVAARVRAVLHGHRARPRFRRRPARPHHRDPARPDPALHRPRRGRRLLRRRLRRAEGAALLAAHVASAHQAAVWPASSPRSARPACPS